MLLGIGSDIVDIERIERLLQRHGTRFTERIFTPQERERAESQAKPAASYAKRFAAKEACAKALGTRIAEGISWQEIEVINNSKGQPSLHLTGVAKQLLERMAPKNTTPQILLSLSDTHSLAQASVIIAAY